MEWGETVESAGWGVGGGERVWTEVEPECEVEDVERAGRVEQVDQMQPAEVDLEAEAQQEAGVRLGAEAEGERWGDGERLVT